MRLLFALFFVSMSFGQVTDIELTTLKACPTCMGGGSSATGGRGYSVYVVSNTNASGAGSLEQAIDDVETNGGGYIVFDVSGIVTLPTGGWSWTDLDNMTIAGQTSPQGGINIEGGRWRFSWDADWDAGGSGSQNLIFRHITSRGRIARDGQLPSTGLSFDFRAVYGSGGVGDDAYTSSLLVTSADGLMIDHCSFSFGYDKALNLGSSDSHNTHKDITVQKTLIADGGTMVQMQGSQNMVQIPGNTGNLSFVYNLLGRGSNRAPNMAVTGYAEILNNVIHAGTSRLTRSFFEMDLNMIGNYYINWASPTLMEHQFHDVTSGTPNIWVRENFYTDIFTGDSSENQKTLWKYKDPDGTIQLPDSFFVSEMHARTVLNPSPIVTAVNARTTVLADVGHNRYVDDSGNSQVYQDTYDTTIINEAENEIRTTPKQAGNWVMPTIPSNSRPAGWDDDVTGIPDVFSTAHGITSIGQVITDWDFGTYTVTNTAGYPAIEIYFAYAADDFNKMIDDEQYYQDGSYTVTNGSGPTPAEAGSIILSRRKQ